MNPMNPILITGSIIVTFALIFYTMAIFQEQKTVRFTKKLLIFLTLGITLDITATAFMIIGSSNSPFTLHGLLGYSSLTLMFLDTILIWHGKSKKGLNQPIPLKLHNYSRLAYTWWVLAYITGAIIAFTN